MSRGRHPSEIRSKVILQIIRLVVYDNNSMYNTTSMYSFSNSVYANSNN